MPHVCVATIWASSKELSFLTCKQAQSSSYRTHSGRTASKKRVKTSGATATVCCACFVWFCRVYFRINRHLTPEAEVRISFVKTLIVLISLSCVYYRSCHPAPPWCHHTLPLSHIRVQHRRRTSAFFSTLQRTEILYEPKGSTWFWWTLPPPTPIPPPPQRTRCNRRVFSVSK